MLIEFDAETLAPHHILLHHPPDYADHLRDKGATFLETPEALDFAEIEIRREAGAFALYRRERMVLDRPASLRVGVEAPIAGVPPGTRISIEGAPLGVMDASGVLDFTAEHAGLYHFELECAGYVTERFSLEALA